MTPTHDPARAAVLARLDPVPAWDPVVGMSMAELVLGHALLDTYRWAGAAAVDVDAASRELSADQIVDVLTAAVAYLVPAQTLDALAANAGQANLYRQAAAAALHIAVLTDADQGGGPPRDLLSAALKWRSSEVSAPNGRVSALLAIGSRRSDPSRVRRLWAFIAEEYPRHW